MEGKIKDKLKSFFSSGPKTIFVIMLVLMCSTIVIISTRKNIIVSIDGKETKITTFKSTFKSALSANNITVGPKDKTSPGLDSEIKNGSKIEITKAVNVQVEVDGKKLQIQTAENNVEKMLEAENIGVQDYDKVSPGRDASISDGMKIVVVRVDSKIIRETQSIDYSTIVKKDDNSERGVNKVLQEGISGEKEIATRVIYEDGKEVSRRVVSETVKKQPTQKIVAMGTLGAITPSRGGKVLYTKALTLTSTAYSGGGHTASGTYVRRNNGGYSSVAVDPRVIPLGTRLYIDGYGYAVAEDTGGAIKGSKIDLYFDTYSETNRWGVRTVTVYVLK